jgi:hypothetical protein
MKGDRQKTEQYGRVPLWAGGVTLSGGRAWQVYVTIAGHANNETDIACLGERRIAEVTGIHRRHIFGLVAEVERAGLIRKEGVGSKRATNYRVFQTPPGERPCGTLRCAISERRHGTLQGQGWHATASGDGTLYGSRADDEQLGEQLSEHQESARADADGQALRPDASVRANGYADRSAPVADHPTQTLPAARAEEPPALIDVGDLDFEEFWRVFPPRWPRPNRKNQSAKDFAAALARGSAPAEIIAEAWLYRREVEVGGIPPKFVKSIKTWLSEESWRDPVQPELAEGKDELEWHTAPF